MEGSEQVLADHLAIAKYLPVTMRSLRPAGEYGRVRAERIRQARNVSDRVFGTVARGRFGGEECGFSRLVSDLSGLEAPDAVSTNPQFFILLDDCHHPQEANERSHAAYWPGSPDGIGQRQATRRVVAIPLKHPI